jgi:hypothetical protein
MLLNKLKKVVARGGVPKDTSGNYFPVYLDFDVSGGAVPSNFFSFTSTTDSSYQTAVTRLGRLFIHLGYSVDQPYYLSYVDASDPRGLNKIWPGFLNTNQIYRSIFRIFQRTSTNKSNRYEIITDGCFNGGTCDNNERDFMFVSLVDASGNIKGFDQIEVRNEITDSLYNSLTLINPASGDTPSNRNTNRFKPRDRFTLNRTTATTTNEKNWIRQFLGPPLIVNYRLYETNLLAVDINRGDSGNGAIIGNSRISISAYLRVNNFSGASSAKVYFYDENQTNDLGKDDVITSTNYTKLYLRKKNGALVQYYKIVLSTRTNEFNSAGTVWKVQSEGADEYIFVHLRVFDDTTNANLNVRSFSNAEGFKAKISRWESDDTIDEA